MMILDFTYNQFLWEYITMVLLPTSTRSNSMEFWTVMAADGEEFPGCPIAYGVEEMNCLKVVTVRECSLFMDYFFKNFLDKGKI